VTSSEALATVLRAQGCQVHVLNALAHAEEATIVAGAGQAGVVTIATNMAGRGTDIRLAAPVIARGGLHVILAEANDSGRIDRQLAGRCGRQGDPGSVATYLCLTDDLVTRMMPAPLRWLLVSLMQTRPAVAAVAARWIFRLTQQRAEAVAFQRRWSVLRSDDWMKSALPFEGRSRERSA
jgi:preprotein translocase subunit SecA